MNDIKKLNLDIKTQTEVEKILHQDRIQWELWMESAVSYATLVKQLKKRGYSNAPISDKPMIADSGNISADLINRLPNQQKMMRRGNR